jgi:hypothetical protein
MYRALAPIVASLKQAFKVASLDFEGRIVTAENSAENALVLALSNGQNLKLSHASLQILISGGECSTNRRRV